MASLVLLSQDKAATSLNVKAPTIAYVGELVDAAKSTAYKTHLCKNIPLFLLVCAAEAVGVAAIAGGIIAVATGGPTVLIALSILGFQVAYWGIVGMVWTGINVVSPCSPENEVNILGEWNEVIKIAKATPGKNSLDSLQRLLKVEYRYFKQPSENISLKNLFKEEAYACFPVASDQKDKWLAFTLIEAMRIHVKSQSQRLSEDAEQREQSVADLQGIATFAGWISKKEKVELTDEQKTFFETINKLPSLKDQAAEWLNHMSGG
jgi:hypothetical protein